MDCVEMFTRKPSASHNEQPNQTENPCANARQKVVCRPFSWLVGEASHSLTTQPKKLTNSNAIENRLPDQIIRKQQQRQKSHSEYNDHRSSVKLSFGRP